MFWRVLLIMFLCAISVEALLIWLGLIIGELAYLVVGFLLLAGIVTVFISSYQKIMNRMNSLEEKLDKLLQYQDENE